MLDQLTQEGFVPRLSLRTDNHVAYLAGIRAGLGVGVSQVPIGSADPTLIRVLPNLTVAELDVWLVMHEDIRHEPRTRAVFDHLAVELSLYAQSAR